MSSIVVAEPNNPHARLGWLYTAMSRVTSLSGLFLTEPIKKIGAKVKQQDRSDLMMFVRLELPRKNDLSRKALPNPTKHQLRSDTCAPHQHMAASFPFLILYSRFALLFSGVFVA